MNFSFESDDLRLEMTLVKADIEIIEMEREDIELACPELRKKTAHEIFDISFSGSTLIVKEKGLGRFPAYTSLFDDSMKTDLKLRIPKNIKVTGFVSDVNGNVDIESIDLSGKVKTISGNIRIGDIAAERLYLNSVSGDIRVGSLNGPLVANTVSGGIGLAGGTIKTLSVKTVSGDISIAAAFDLEEDGSVDTVSGGIKLNVFTYNSDKNVYLSTLSGSIAVDGDYPEEKFQTKRRMPFLKNRPFKDFMPTVKNIISNFSAMKDGAGIEIHTKAEGEDGKSVEMVLEMLAQGKISADEATKLIETIKG
ncbi:MAG: DUF4097 domain-containing protein [Proteobacteria bacterium]|nr:DUF4097 domain-containing protein [Pseudomonadota bacterium]